MLVRAVAAVVPVVMRRPLEAVSVRVADTRWFYRVRRAVQHVRKVRRFVAIAERMFKRI